MAWRRRRPESLVAGLVLCGFLLCAKESQQAPGGPGGAGEALELLATRPGTPLCAELEGGTCWPIACELNRLKEHSSTMGRLHGFGLIGLEELLPAGREPIRNAAATASVPDFRGGRNTDLARLKPVVLLSGGRPALMGVRGPSRPGSPGKGATWELLALQTWQTCRLARCGVCRAAGATEERDPGGSALGLAQAEQPSSRAAGSGALREALEASESHLPAAKLLGPSSV